VRNCFSGAIGIDSDSQYRTFGTAVKHSFTLHSDTDRVLVTAWPCFEALEPTLRFGGKTLDAKFWVQPVREDELQLWGIFLPSVGTARNAAEPLRGLIAREKLSGEGN
jgi:hypothetical protein